MWLITAARFVKSWKEIGAALLKSSQITDFKVYGSAYVSNLIVDISLIGGATLYHITDH